LSHKFSKCHLNFKRFSSFFSQKAKSGPQNTPESRPSPPKLPVLGAKPEMPFLTKLGHLHFLPAMKLPTYQHIPNTQKTLHETPVSGPVFIVK
jgi:hypothetical protein